MKSLLLIITFVTSLNSFAYVEPPYFCVQSIELFKLASKVDTYVAVGDGFSKQEAFQDMKRKSSVSHNACKLKSKKIGVTSWCYKTQIKCYDTYPYFNWDDMFE